MLNEMFFRTYAAAVSLNRKQEGASAVEYGLILGLIAVVIIAVLTLVGTDLRSLFQGAADALPTPAATPPSGS